MSLMCSDIISREIAKLPLVGICLLLIIVSIKKVRCFNHTDDLKRAYHIINISKYVLIARDLSQ